MVIIQDNPTKSHWTLTERMLDDGSTHVITGRHHGAEPCPAAHAIIGTRSRHNIIFRARIRLAAFVRGRSSVAFLFHDMDDENKYETGAAGMEAIFIHVQIGRFPVLEGGIFGTFTFAKQGNEIYLIPYES